MRPRNPKTGRFRKRNMNEIAEEEEDEENEEDEEEEMIKSINANSKLEIHDL